MWVVGHFSLFIQVSVSYSVSYFKVIIVGHLLERTQETWLSIKCSNVQIIFWDGTGYNLNNGDRNCIQE